MEEEIARLKARLAEKEKENDEIARLEAELAKKSEDVQGTEQVAADFQEGAKAVEDEKDTPKVDTEGPVVLWKAPPLKNEFGMTEHLLRVSAVASGSGLGMALLGIAPFTAPNPFMVGLLLAVMQVRLTHIWGTRTLRAQTRRHVTELVQTIESDDVLVTIQCDGGVIRKLRLRSPAGSEKKPSFADIMKQGRTYIFFDMDLGKAEQPAFDELLSSKHVLVSEELLVTPFEEESKEEAEKMVQRLVALTHEDLKQIQGKDVVTPKRSLAGLRRSGQLLGGVVLTAGLLICLSGRYSADVQLSQM